MRELIEETGLDPAGVLPASQTPVYIEYGQVPGSAEEGRAGSPPPRPRIRIQDRLTRTWTWVASRSLR
ncbi:hypothetical protein [Streptomyces sp. CBMA123]|uniref:hypothetical protein n=1 Tax=Streptomyces sp. CBMA123 TaxID=1896313 RepID=UPI003982E7AB